MESSERLRFSKFAEKTGLSRDIIKNLYHGKQRFNEEHIEAICSTFPTFRYWFVFGEEAPEIGQVSPSTEKIPTTG
ncbi:helix-turn-helix transcriptional regulator [uncultured Pseudoteredinibacter sp.]|uniref:helix-turn-helix domain-containing protein n=1 Tax=uncultured Pseudoteredinibacter sp. TaxID=1641701 RepID=UPI00262E7E2E|nr:helix-turn-helix transcriptional regulator [uncultured Pseudoteredinibacter sp.]